MTRLLAMREVQDAAERRSAREQNESTPRLHQVGEVGMVGRFNITNSEIHRGLASKHMTTASPRGPRVYVNCRGGSQSVRISDEVG
jgi:hypothetical protein